MKAMLDLLMILFIELQFLAYLHAFSITYPANAQIFVQSLVSFVEFQVINP